MTIKEYERLSKAIEKASAPYWKNFEQIEDCWKNTKADPSPKNQARLIELCSKGMEYFGKMRALEVECFGEDCAMPTSIPCYKRMIMLYKLNKDWVNGLDFCQKAKAITGNYDKEIAFFLAKASNT